MSSSGITPINSGPLILRTYLNSSSNNTYAVGPYDDPVPANRILVTSTGGLVVPSDSITISSMSISTLSTTTLNVSTLNTSTLYVSDVADISTLVVSTLHVGVIDGCVTISTLLSPSTLTFTTPGSYIVPIEDETSMAFEMIGAGGFGGTGGTGGTGGYIAGTINLPSGATQIKVVVGGVGGGEGGAPSGASYITVPSVGPLLAIAGAGGASVGFLIAAGWGGGGTFTSGVAPGGNAVSPSAGGGGGGSIVTLTEGGLAGSGCLFPIQGTPGGDAGSSGLFDEALGGFSPAIALTPGGSGYAGGGSGCGGGGGSSYIDVAHVVGVTSYAGNMLPVGTLPGYGRSNLGGYVSITLSHDDCNNVSLTANGDIIGRKLIATQGCINLSQSTNVTAATPGIIGDIRWDDDYIYVSTTVGWRKTQQLVPV